MAEPKRGSSDGESDRLWRLTGLGGTMASEILAGALIGWVLDRLFDTKPVLLMVGTILGVVIGLGTFIRSAMIETRRAGREGRRIAATLKEDHDRDEHPDLEPPDSPDPPDSESGP